MSAIRHRFSRQPSSFTARMRNVREAPNLSDRKSSDQRSPGLRASGIGVRDPPRPLAPSSPDARLLLRVQPIEGSTQETIPRTVCVMGFDVVHDHTLAFLHHADPPGLNRRRLAAIASITLRISGLSGGRSRRSSLDRHRQVGWHGAARCVATVVLSNGAQMATPALPSARPLLVH